MDAEIGLGCFVVALIVVTGIFAGAILEHSLSDDYKLGYTQALADVENKVPLKYIRQEQPNKEIIWVLNEDHRKEK